MPIDVTLQRGEQRQDDQRHDGCGLAISNFPAPAAVPIAALTQIVAAVVRPLMFIPLRRMAPPPRNPIPVTICAAMRSGVPFEAPRSIETMVNRAAPTQ